MLNVVVRDWRIREWDRAFASTATRARVGRTSRPGRPVLDRARLRRPILISTRDQEELAELIESAPVRGFIPKNRLSAAAVHRLM